MDLTLEWDGPVGPGDFPDDFDGRAALAVPGVYLRLKTYAGGRTVGYVGQSKNLLSRFDQHLRDILTFSVTLRDAAGDVALPRDGGDRLAAYNKLGQLMPLIAEEAGRICFIYAPCGEFFDVEFLNLAEAGLKERLEQRLGGDFTALENRQAVPIPGLEAEVMLQSDFSALPDDAAARVKEMLGTDPFRFAPPEESLSHAG